MTIRQGRNILSRARVRYHFDHMGDRLKIGRFCAIAEGAEFIMNGANHALDGFSTYPFAIFGEGWDDPCMSIGRRARAATPLSAMMSGSGPGRPSCLASPSATVRSLAPRPWSASDVPAYRHRPRQLLPERMKRRFPDEDDRQIIGVVAWWNWSAEKITANLAVIRGADIDALESGTVNWPLFLAPPIFLAEFTCNENKK